MQKERVESSRCTIPSQNKDKSPIFDESVFKLYPTDDKNDSFMSISDDDDNKNLSFFVSSSHFIMINDTFKCFLII